MCADWLVSAWPAFDDGVQETIKRDIEQSFERDDEDRAEGREHKHLGHDCDRAEWQRVRKLWSAA